MSRSYTPNSAAVAVSEFVCLDQWPVLMLWAKVFVDLPKGETRLCECGMFCDKRDTSLVTVKWDMPDVPVRYQTAAQRAMYRCATDFYSYTRKEVKAR